MKIGLIGLGRMGEAIAYRLLQSGHMVVGSDQNAAVCAAAAQLGVQCVSAITQFPQDIEVFWLMVPSGPIVDSVIEQLQSVLKKGSIIIDGGNSKFTDSMRRAAALKQKNIFFLDCGTSGGVRGREDGFSLMIGGDKKAFETVESVFRAIAMPCGYGYMGPSGSGHYVKMVHNGIEYALLQAYAEGFQVLKEGAFKELDLEKISDVWLHGSIIRSFILELTHEIFKHDQEFKNISGKVAQTGMGLWTVQEAADKKIPVPLIQASLRIREESLKTGGNYATKLIALLRNKFGGHEVKTL